MRDIRKINHHPPLFLCARGDIMNPHKEDEA